jgi:hypothetical protein
MNVFRLLRFFLPLQNPVGFGLTDFIELAVVLLMALALLARTPLENGLRKVAGKPVWSMALLAALPIVLRLLLLPHHPVPVPQTADDFSYLLLGDTLAHFRLANATHPMHRFFETVFVLQEPTYSSIYPLGQGIVLAIGELIFRLPWAGVALSVGAMCALVYWMLLAWVNPAWALVGGLLAVMEFGPLNQWINTYWGGAVSAIAGCLVFGAIPRLRASGRDLYAALAGIGIGLEILSRPFETLMLVLCAVPPLLYWRTPRRSAGIVVLAALPALALTLVQNKAVTGSFLTLPYMLSRYQYGIPATFTFQKNAVPHRELTQEQKLDYQAQTDVHGDQPETFATYFTRLAGRIRFFRFFFLPPLYIALLFFLPALRERRFLWAAASVALFVLGSNFYPYYYPHYIAAVTCLLILFSVVGLSRLGGDAMRLLALLCLAHFAFWYGIHLFGSEDLFIATGQYESWDFVNFGDSEGRIAIGRQLAAAPGKQLVFVRFGPRHLLREWEHNDADIDRSRVVWALDLGEEEDAKLIQYYPDRKAWIVEPDATPPKLTPYVLGPSAITKYSAGSGPGFRQLCITFDAM